MVFRGIVRGVLRGSAPGAGHIFVKVLRPSFCWLWQGVIASLVGLALATGSTALAVDRPTDVPAWDAMNANELLDAVSEGKSRSPHQLFVYREEVGKRAAELLASNSHALSTAQLASLVELGRSYLSRSQTQQLQQRIDLWSPLSTSTGDFAELKHRVELMRLGKMSPKDVGAIVARWLDGRNISELPSPDLAWLSNAVAGPQVGLRDLEVRWTGTLELPATGGYRFSTSPIRLSESPTGNSGAEQSMQVLIDGTEVLNWNGKEGGQDTSVTVNFRDSDIVPVEVRYSYRALGETSTANPAVAQLFWEGPGIPRGIVPSRFFNPDRR